MPTDPTRARYYRKQVRLFRLVDKMRLWPSRRGVLHSIRDFEERGPYAFMTTHCDERMVVRDSRSSRAARWLRNKWYAEACPRCGIPEWKLQKYAATRFRRDYGSDLGRDSSTT
jgi:pyrrolysyl-tRNA synthetase-like protein